MQFSDLQTRAQALCSFEGWSDVNPQPNWPVLVNTAWEQFSWDSEIVVVNAMITTVVGQAQYTLPTTTNGPFKRLLDVVWDPGNTNLPIVRSVEEFERSANAAWLFATPAQPLRWTYGTLNTISLSPPPNSAKQVLVRGVVQGADMMLPTDQPGQSGGQGVPIPGVFHEAIAYRAAWLQGIIYAQGEATARLQWLEQRYKEYVTQGRADLLLGYRRSGEQEP